MHLLDTGGSILAIAVQHAAWNSAADLAGVRGEWQPIAAAILLTALGADLSGRYSNSCCMSCRAVSVSEPDSDG